MDQTQPNAKFNIRHHSLLPDKQSLSLTLVITNQSSRTESALFQSQAKASISCKSKTSRYQNKMLNCPNITEIQTLLWQHLKMSKLGVFFFFCSLQSHYRDYVGRLLPNCILNKNFDKTDFLNFKIKRYFNRTS